MVGFIVQIIELFKSVLPSDRDRGKIWFAKLAFVSFLAALFLGGALYVLTQTTWGEQYNIRLVKAPPELTNKEMISTSLEAWKAISRPRIEYSADIRAVFFMVLIDLKTKNVVQKNDIPSSQTELLIWQFDIPVDRWGRALETVEEIANKLKPEFESALKNNRQCITFALKGEEVQTLRQRINNFVSTHASICPVHTFSDSRLIGATVEFFRISPPRAPWFYEEQLHIATSDLSRNFRSFNIKYLVTYE